VLRLVLDRSGARAALAADGEGRTAVHHAAAVNGAREVALLLEGALGGQAALAKVRGGARGENKGRGEILVNMEIEVLGEANGVALLGMHP